ncbi:G-type lectin S-receptor-like serine/threonine-protein kinase-like protein [Drosera capensis]
MRLSSVRHSTINFVWSFMWLTLITASTAVDTITITSPLKDGENLTSAGGRFALGFFSPGNQGARYVGIWYNTIPVMTIVWVANRQTPVIDKAGVLCVRNHPPRLVIVNGTGGVIWSTNSTGSLQNPVAQILDSGNLVIRDRDDASPDDFLWQSFDYPSNIHMPGMKLGWNLTTGLNRYITSWKSSNDPSVGSYTYGIDLEGYPEPVLMKGSVEQYRNGPWNGVRFVGNQNLKPNSLFTYDFFLNNQEVYYIYDLVNTSILTHRILGQYGTMQRLNWDEDSQGWVVYLTEQSNSCDNYGTCGSYGSCNIATTTECECLTGYVPRSPVNWKGGDWSDGCVRKTPLTCGKGDAFMRFSNVKLPDTQYAWYNMNMSLNDCRKMCLGNCSCLAYANIFVTNGGAGCFMWFDVLMDIEILTQNGQDLYVKLAAEDILALRGGNEKLWTAVGCSILGIPLLILGITLHVKKILRRHEEAKKRAREEEGECPAFQFNTIAHATNKFSDDNKLGEGGFGPVYKGVLKGGKEIAVKRLSKDSKQGLEEFKNEVVCIARLQHRNLVRLFGCCIRGEERMLIYEYMPNQSLDYFIFDEKRRMLLDWPRRFQIITGIARGLVYLHEDSRLRIIHRDLKASNILLDANLNPKISDFGMARSFEGADSQAMTLTVVGTYGYMPPEYVIDGQFSVKSDVFSFGVLLLEIVSGKRNRGFNNSKHGHNLIGHAWSRYLEGAGLDVLDPLIAKSCIAPQVLRSIHIGLLCVQQSPDERPTMSSVMMMLDSGRELPKPNLPGFFIGRIIHNESSHESVSSKKISAKVVYAR